MISICLNENRQELMTHVIYLICLVKLMVGSMIPFFHGNLVPSRQGIGSVFGFPGDRWAGGNLACAPDRPVADGERVCAHRTYRCGTVLIIENVRTKKRSWCHVMDHGPYGAIAVVDGEKKWVLKASKDDPGHWRGIVDLSPAVSADIDHNGFEKVKIWKLKDVATYLKRIQPENI